MSSLLPRFGTSTKKVSPSYQSDNSYTSPRNLISHIASFNPTLTNTSTEYQPKKVLMTTPSETYNDSLLKKYATTPEKPYHTKTISESSNPFQNKKIDYGFNLDIPEIGSMYPNDLVVKTPGRRILDRGQRISEDVNSQYDRARTDRYSDLAPSVFDLPSISKPMLSSRGDLAHENPVKPVTSSHTKQIYQQTALQLLNSKQETPKAGIIKFNSSTHLSDPVPVHYGNTESNQNNRVLPTLGLQNLNPKLRDQFSKQEPVSARARLGYDQTMSMESPFNAGLLNLKSPTSGVSQADSLLAKKVSNFKETKPETSVGNVATGRKPSIAEMEGKEKASFIIKKRTSDSEAREKYTYGTKKNVPETESYDKPAYLSKKSIPETEIQDRFVYSSKTSIPEFEAPEKAVHVSKKSVTEGDVQERFNYASKSSVLDLDVQEKPAYVTKKSITEIVETQEKVVPSIAISRKNNSEPVEVQEKHTVSVKKSSFDLIMETEKAVEQAVGSKRNSKMSTQASLETGHASMPVIKNPSSGSSQNNIFDNKPDSLPVIPEVSEVKNGIKPILRIRVREPLESPEDRFLFPTEKKVIFDLPPMDEKEEEKQGEESAFKKFKSKLKKKAKKIETKPTLKSILWGMTISTLWKDSVKNKNEYRIIRNKEFSVTFYSDKQTFLQFAAEHLKEPLLKLAQEKNKLTIVGPKGSIKDINSRCVKIHDHILSLLERLKYALETNFLPGSIYKNIVASFRNGSSVPDYYLSEFELERLEFTPSFALKRMNIFRSKMLIGGYMILRILLLEVIMRPWQALSKIQSSKVNISNLQIIGSVIYQAVKDIFNDSLNPVRNSPEGSNLDDRAKVSLDIVVTSPTANANKMTEPTFEGLPAPQDKNEEIIPGFETREALSQLVTDRTVLFQDIKKSLEDILEFLHRVTYKGVKKEKSYYLKNQ